MKTIQNILIAVLSILQITIGYSQNVKIHGNIIDDGYGSVILSPTIYSRLIDSKIEFSPKRGYFEFNIQIDRPCFYKLFYRNKRISLYLEPNKFIQLSIDNTKEIDYVNFFGELIIENNYINQDNIPTIGNPEQRNNLREKASISHNAYKKYLEEETTLQSNKFISDMSQASFSQEFIELYDRNNIEMSSLLFQYYYTKFISKNSDSFIAQNPNVLDFYSKLPEAINYEGSHFYFENLLIAHKAKINQNFKINFIKNSVDDLTLYKSYIKAATQLNSGIERDFLLENLIGEWITQYGRTLDLKDEIFDYVNNLPEGHKKESVKKKLVHLAQYETGKPAPIFSFEDNSGNVRNLKEFVGKIIYLFVWSSKTPRILEEIKAMNNMCQHYHGKNIEFIFISIDESKEQWESFIRKNQLNNGIQGISYPNGFNSDLGRKYSIQSLPSIIIIDMSGNIVTNKAPHPSHLEKTYPLLNKLLGISLE